MKKITKVLMDRDELTESEAVKIKKDTRQTAFAMISEGASLQEMEDLVMDELGLEPDFLEELIF